MCRRSLLVATSVVALNAWLACESARPLADDLLRMDAGEQPGRGGAARLPPEDASAPVCEGRQCVPGPESGRCGCLGDAGADAG